MSNENLIEYQNKIKQQNLENITSYQQTITSIDQAILQMNLNIESYNSQKIEYQNNITDAQEGNDLIDQTIAILSQK